MSFTLDTSNLEESLQLYFADALNPQSNLYREVVVDLVPEIHDRIHVQGKAANGEQIGTYTPEYMKVRTGEFSNSDKFKKGKNKGQAKNAGTFTERTIKLNKQTGVYSGEDKVGTARPMYNRTADKKVILSLTRQLENDYVVVGIPHGWGVGFNNKFNEQKALWNDKRYGKVIFALTKEELDFATKRTQQVIIDKYQ